MRVNGGPSNYEQLVCTNHNVVHKSEVVPPRIFNVFSHLK